uniref:ASA1 n=1 Tax=Arundo donax TaxID=35708 RepID=A0A0A9AWP2_ARUDO
MLFQHDQTKLRHCRGLNVCQLSGRFLSSCGALVKGSFFVST